MVLVYDEKDQCNDVNILLLENNWIKIFHIGEGRDHFLSVFGIMQSQMGAKVTTFPQKNQINRKESKTIGTRVERPS